MLMVVSSRDMGRLGQLLRSQSSLSWPTWGNVEPVEEMNPELCSVKKTDSRLSLRPRSSSKGGRVGWSPTLSSAMDKSLEGDVVVEGVGVITLSRAITTTPR